MENILVSIRMRPLSKQEASKGNPWKLTPKSIALSSGASISGQTYNFDRVFDPNSKTVDIYDTHTKKIISSAVQGFNGTIFAYGQTSSGKTYTMRGTSDEPGIIPLAIQGVFRNIELAQNREFLVRVSYMEIYNEEIKDLLAPENCKLQIHENFEKGIFVAGLREEIVVSTEQVLTLMDLGEAHRHVGETNMNVHSSRSHAIFRMVIESRDRSQDDPEDREILQNSDPVRVSHLNLVDLAGSERVAKTGAEGARLKEGTHINKSLMTLGNVINKLSEGIEKQGGHVPYRDSKLTRILQPALGGNARTVIICNITPALVHVDESKGTLHFASRANRVTNCAQVNEIVTDAALLKRQKKEIAELRQKLQNQESPSEQFEEEILNLRNELLKTELERERMALELQEFQKAQAERERRIKEQEQKIENLSTMVINSAVDDREFEKRSKRSNRRETWCARPQSGLPLLPDVKRSSQKDAPKTPKTASSGFPIQINRERSFGLPPPFEALMEEDEDTFTSCSFVFQERLSIDDGFTLPEPGPQSSVSDRRRRPSDEYKVGNELEQQLSDLQGQYDTLQCDYIIKMDEKDCELDKLKRDLAYTRLNLSKSGKDSHKKVQDPEKRGKSLDGWKERESLATIKQLRAQVRNLETEKLYMERELHRLSEQAREQNEISRQELDEVYEKLNLAKETCAKLSNQLGMTLQEVQQLQMEKRENEVLYSQLSSALKDLKTELDDIGQPCGGLQSSINESLQHLTIHVKAFQECLADARDLSALGQIVNEHNNAKFTSEAASSGDLNLSGQKSVELDEIYSCNKVTKSYAEIVRNCPNEQQMNAGEKKLTRQEGVQPLHWSVENKLYQSNDDGKESQVDELAGTIESKKKEELQSGDHKDCEIKHCYSVLVEQKPGTCIDFDRLEEEKHILLSAVDDLRMQIEHASLEKQLREQAVLHDELDKLKASIQVMGDDKSNLSETDVQGERNSLLSAVNSLRTEIQHASSEKQSLLLRKAVLQDDLDNLKSCLQEMEDEKSSLTETDLHEERNNLLAAVDSLHLQTDLVSSEKQGLLQKKSVLQDELDNLKTCLEVMEDEKSLSETKLHGERNNLLSVVDSLQMQIEQASSEKEGLLLRQALLQDELNNLKSCLQVMEQERSFLSESIQNCEEGIAKEHQPCRFPSSSQFPESEHLRRGHAADSQATADESLPRLEAELSKLKEENNSLSVSLASLRGESEWALLELQTSALRESVLRDKVESLKVMSQSVEEERNRYIRAFDEAAEELGRLETVVEKLAMLLAAVFEKCDRLYETSEFSGVNNTLRKFEGQMDCANDELKSVCESVETLLVAVKQAALEEIRLLRRESALSEELHHVKSSLQSVEDKNTSLAGRLEEIQGVLLRESAFSEELHQVKSSLLSAEDENTSLTRRLEEIQGVLLRESAFSEELHQVKSSLQSVEDENTSLRRRLEQTQSVSLREFALSEELQHVKSSLQMVEDKNTSLTRRLEEAQTVVQMVSALSDELHHMKSSLQSVEDEKESLKRRFEETQSKLDCRKAEMNAIASKVRSFRPNKNGTEEQEELSALVPEIESLIKEKESLEKRVDILHADLLLSRKEIDRLSSREASLEEEATSLKLSVEEKEDDKKLWMKIGEERLADIERQKTELLSTRKDHADAQKDISDLNSLLSEKLDELDRLNKKLKLLEEEEGRLNKKLKDVEEEKNGLIRTADELDNQLQALRAGAAEALKEMEGWQQRYQTESTHYRAEITSLRKELSAAKSLPGALTKERDGLHRDLEKTKSKIKDIEAKLKTTIQDKSKLETEKVNMDRELKQLRQSTMLQRDISRRDSIVDQRRQSIVLGVNKTKNQLSSVEHALQLKMEELENLTYELSRSHESYAKLEFAMAEAESYSNEKVAQLEEALAALKDERNAAIARLQNDMDTANEQFRANFNELTEKLQESEGERTVATALAAAVTKEKEDIVEELLDAHISFQRQKAELSAEAQENREKFNLLNQDIVLLTEELQKLKKLQEEASDANRVLQDQLQQALETNTEKSLAHHKLVKEFEADVESYKEQCRKLQQHLQSAQKHADDLRFCGSQHLEELRLELQQCVMKLSTAKDEEQMLLTENRSLLVANTKLQFALDASRDRLEIFEDRSHESDWELTEFKSLLQKAGFVRGNQWNLASLQQFAKHVKAQNNEARRLETDLASRKIEMIDLEVQLESNRAQCDKYQEEIQYLKTKVLTPEQETGVREIVLENKKLKAQLKKTEEKAQELHELVKGKEVSLNALQGTLGSIHAQNAKLQKDLAASKAELESLQQLHKILMRAGASAKSLPMSSSKPVRPEKLKPQVTSQSSRFLPSNLFQDSGSPVSMAKSACTESTSPGCRVPLSEKSSNDSPRITERKQARLFPVLERSKLSRSLGLGPRYFTLPESRSHVDLNKENFTLH